MKDCPSFFGSSRYARKKLGQPPARFGITYNAWDLTISVGRYSLFFGLAQYARKKLGQPPARFGIVYNAPGLCARRRQSHFLLRSLRAPEAVPFFCFGLAANVVRHNARVATDLARTV